MTIFTDGTIQLFAVFHGDGYECNDFIGVFDSEEKGKTCADYVQALADTQWKQLQANHPEMREQPPPDIVSVVPVTVNQYAMHYDPGPEKAGSQ